MLRLDGGATVFDDLQSGGLAGAKTGGAKDPGLSVFKTNGAGSIGVFLYWFDPTVEEELFFLVQMRHAWKEGSTIEPHVHWTPKTNGAAGQKVSWGLEYTWANVGGDFGNTSIIYGNTTVQADSSLVAGRHYITPLPDIVATGKTLSSVLVCRIFRDAPGTGGTDSYTDDAGLLFFDIHIEIDGLGSEEEFIKV
jgi:hypothetical protein